MRIVSICGITFLIDELVQSTTTSGLADFSAFVASSDTLTPSRFGQPDDIAEIAADLRRIDVDGAHDLESGRAATCLTMAAPIGPSPKCITRMLGITCGL